jgi:hypothetical protein
MRPLWSGGVKIRGEEPEPFNVEEMMKPLKTSIESKKRKAA